MNGRMRLVAVENAKRLIYLAAVFLELRLKTSPLPYPSKPGAAKKEEASVTTLMAEGGDYRCDVSPDHFMEEEEVLIELCAKALTRFWIEGVQMPTFFCLPGRAEEGRVPHDSKLHGFPIGAILKQIKDKNPKAWEHFQAEHGIELIETPLAVKELIATEYNTYRLDKMQAPVWYSNCSPIEDAAYGVASLQPVKMGLKVYWSLLGSGGAYSRSKPLSNAAGNAFPVLFPFKPDNKKVSRRKARNSSSTMAVKSRRSSWGARTSGRKAWPKRTKNSGWTPRQSKYPTCSRSGSSLSGAPFLPDARFERL